MPFSQAVSPFRLPLCQTYAIWPTYKNTCYEHPTVVEILGWPITETLIKQKETGQAPLLFPKRYF